MKLKWLQKIALLQGSTRLREEIVSIQAPLER
jgi:hypothetical protein